MIFKFFSKIPVLGPVLRIFNTYAFRGDVRSDDKLAGIRYWVSGFWVQSLIAIVATLGCMPEIINSFIPFNSRFVYSIDTQPGSLAISILPNLLGFGIGVYALIFALESKIIKNLQNVFSKANEEKNLPGSALLLNATMAVPLVILTITIAFGVVQGICNENIYVKAVTWFFFWLSIIFILDLIDTIFNIGEVHISNYMK
ncbi:hypothetical protein [Pseudomonas sp.]|uniref:hypothetical protein n=1 Tax=Pseudomonas sp. TaxID=306 RepID=UPI00289D3062|nr:hypothetical protein [Pseudomonas sp.]